MCYIVIYNFKIVDGLMPTYGFGSLYFLNYTSTQQTFKIELKIKSISAFLLQKVHT